MVAMKRDAIMRGYEWKMERHKKCEAQIYIVG